MDKIQGLSQAEADRILKAEGFNELPSQKKQGWFSVLLRVFSEPMLSLLFAIGAIYFFIGELQDSLVLFAAVVVIIGITYYQERKTEKTLEALRDLSSPRALVVRDGEQKRIAGREVVRGDIVIVREGDRVPADAAVLFCENLFVDESLLTGESIAVSKIEWDGEAKTPRPGGDSLPFIYAGSMVIGGRGMVKVNSTGINTEIGKIGKSLENIKDEDTLLHKETKKIVRLFAMVGLFLCAVVAVLYAVIKGDIIAGLLSGLTLSISMLPEEFPVVLLIFMTLGAWRISKRKVLTRRAAAIETLGAATVLCTDKTGTLTLNKMQLDTLYAKGSSHELSSQAGENLPEKFKDLLLCGILASQKDPFDPIEKELNKVGSLYLKNITDNLTMIKEYPLSKTLSAISHVWQSKDKQEFIVSAKGSPEAILELCDETKEEHREIIKKVEEMSDRGLRVLGAARASFLGEVLPSDQHNFKFEFVGLLGFVDPIRDTAQEAVKEVYDAGMRVIMITGDYPGTAQFIAQKIGIKNPEKYLTGEDLDKMDHLELREKIKDVNIFARVVPEQKLLIVNALKANDEIVAMTGDGVNDAPALKAAHIGVAMGERGTDVAREASALVLLNDDFSSIVAAVRLGRRIYSNLKRAMGYILAVHVPIAGMAVLPLVFDLPAVLLPAHIAFLELIIDPACSTVFESEKEDKDIMKRPPRNLREPIFNRRTISISVIQGLGVLIATFVLFVFSIKSDVNELEARSVAFTTLVLANLALIAINLSWKKNLHKILLSPNKMLVSVSAGAFLCLLAILYIPFLSNLFHLAPIHLKDFGLIFIAIFASLAWFEIFKLLRNSKQPKYS